LETTEKRSLKTIRFTALEARLLEESAKAHNMTVSDVVRNAVVQWREHIGDRQGALDQWTSRLVAEHGKEAMLVARLNDEFSLDVEIDGQEMGDFVAQAVFDRRDQVQLWIGDPDTDARVYLGRVRQLAGAAISVPISALPALGASDADAV
jgi:hypothetical protein